MIDYDAIDPGVRRLVRWLNDRAFKTTDSGDGVSKVGVMECALDVPNVFMVVSRADLLDEADRLFDALEEVGIVLGATEDGGGKTIEASYSPGPRDLPPQPAIIALYGVSDADMPEAPA